MNKLPAIKKGNIRFRRIHGRIVPITIGAGVTSATGGTIAAMESRTGRTKGPHKGFVAASYGAQVASGLVAAIPPRNRWGFVATMAGSIALDTIATALNTKSVLNMQGNNYKKAKKFAEQQAIGTGIGYGVFGAALLGQKSVRVKTVQYATKLIKRIKGKWL